MAQNSFSILEKIIASSNHYHLHDDIIKHVNQFYEIAFGEFCDYEGYSNQNSKYKQFSRISFCYCIKLLGISIFIFFILFLFFYFYFYF